MITPDGRIDIAAVRRHLEVHPIVMGDPRDLPVYDPLPLMEEPSESVAPPVIRLIEAFLAQWPEAEAKISTQQTLTDRQIGGTIRWCDHEQEHSAFPVRYWKWPLRPFLEVLLLIPEAERFRQVREWCGGDETKDEV